MWIRCCSINFFWFIIFNLSNYKFLGSQGLSYDLIRDITNLNIIDGQNYSGELLYDRMFIVLESYGKTYSLISDNSFKLLFDLNVMSNGAMVGASGAIMGILVAFGMLNPNAELMFILFLFQLKPSILARNNII